MGKKRQWNRNIVISASKNPVHIRDYSLLLNGQETTHHFAVTEVYVRQGDEWKLVQFSFTALVYSREQ